ILVPSSTFQLITDANEARDAMRRLFSHLEPGGAFVTAFGFDWREGEPLDKGWEVRELIRPEDGATITLASHEWHEPAKQLWHEERRIEVHLNGKLLEREEMRH